MFTTPPQSIIFMSKEEIVCKHFIRAKNDEDGNKVYTFPPSGLFNSMNQYAKETSIAFAEWVSMQGYKGSRYGFWHDSENNQIASGTEELYTLYIQSISK